MGSRSLQYTVYVMGFGSEDKRLWRKILFPSRKITASKVLHQHGAGSLRDIQQRLQSLPACFGPWTDWEQAQKVTDLLNHAGIVATIEEFHIPPFTV